MPDHHDPLVLEARAFIDELFSTGVPLQDLLNKGRFPNGWTARYLSFLERVRARCGTLEPMPREVVAVIYNASVYCTKRFIDWHLLRNDQIVEGEDDPETYQAINEIRGAGDQLMLAPFYPDK